MQNNIHKTYNVLPGPKMGLISAEYLEQVAAIARKHQIPFLKITGAQRIAIAGHAPDAVEQIWKEMGQERGPRQLHGIHTIQACPGIRWCKYGRNDSLAMGEKIEASVRDISLPGKTKVAVSGCAFNCCESYIRDIGVFAMRKGWTVVFGGNGGGTPRIGDIVGKDLDDDQVIALIGRCLDFYRDRARKLERAGRLMLRTSVQDLQEYLQTG